MGGKGWAIDSLIIGLKILLSKECSRNVRKVCIILCRKRSLDSFVNSLRFQRLFGFLTYLKHSLLHELASSTPR